MTPGIIVPLTAASGRIAAFGVPPAYKGDVTPVTDPATSFPMFGPGENAPWIKGFTPGKVAPAGPVDDGIPGADPGGEALGRLFRLPCAFGVVDDDVPPPSPSSS